jgi:hypothetical protein
MVSIRILFYNVYTWKFNFDKNMWDKNVVLLGTSWATHWKLEIVENSPKHKIIKIFPSLMHIWAFSDAPPSSLLDLKKVQLC